MQTILQQLQEIRSYTGNAQIALLDTYKSPILKQILEYTYDPHRKYKIEESKFEKVQVNYDFVQNDLHSSNWEQFTELLDKLVELKSAKDEHVYEVKKFIYSFKEHEFLKQVLFKDLRLNMNVKKFQKIWPDFCVQPQVQLAQKFEGKSFNHNRYSRKMDGSRCYYLNGIPKTRTNKDHKFAPLQHITDQLKLAIPDLDNWVLDGEIIYLDNEKEDFKKAISLCRSDKREIGCEKLYYVIFDIIEKSKFLTKSPYIPFTEEYKLLLNMFEAQTYSICWFKTKFPNILIMNQVDDEHLEELQQARFKNNWEGLMLRDGDACYEYKRTNKLLKIKEMQDLELKLIDMEQGDKKYNNMLGAFIVDYNGNQLRVGSGFSDEQRQEYWINRDKYLNQYVKVKYFEKTTNQQGGESLRFPIFQCFRNMETMQEFLSL